MSGELYGYGLLLLVGFQARIAAAVLAFGLLAVATEVEVAPQPPQDVALAALVFGALGAGAWLYRRADASELPAYRFATVERGSLRSTVSATGALSAVRTVQVGTQVSGQVFVDFNNKVRKGQLLATIDPTLQRQAVEDAQAGLDRAQAQYDLAKQEYDRNKQLFDAQIITAAEFGTINGEFDRPNAKTHRMQREHDGIRIAH